MATSDLVGNPVAGGMFTKWHQIVQTATASLGTGIATMDIGLAIVCMHQAQQYNLVPTPAHSAVIVFGSVAMITVAIAIIILQALDPVCQHLMQTMPMSGVMCRRLQRRQRLGQRQGRRHDRQQDRQEDQQQGRRQGRRHGRQHGRHRDQIVRIATASMVMSTATTDIGLATVLLQDRHPFNLVPRRAPIATLVLGSVATTPVGIVIITLQPPDPVCRHHMQMTLMCGVVWIAMALQVTLTATTDIGVVTVCIQQAHLFNLVPMHAHRAAVVSDSVATIIAIREATVIAIITLQPLVPA